MIPKEKCIADIIQIVPNEIVSFVKENKINAIVNAAKPTLMGSSELSVDRSIHMEIDKRLRHGKKFNDIIKAEVDKGKHYDEDVIRCKRGEAVVTPGQDPHSKRGLCEYVIHVVGTKYDGLSVGTGPSKKISGICTSSCIQKLESCYYQIVKAVMEHPDIKTIAIPVVSSGNYGFPFKTAVRVALASIGNALMDWRKRDREFFNRSAIQKIYLCIYSDDPVEKCEKYQLAGKIWKDYEEILRYDNKVVVQKTALAQFRYLREIWKNDENRGYFAIAKNFRLLLMVLRLFFLPVLYVKDILGGYNWERRRTVVEGTVILKMLLPAVFYFIIHGAGYSPELSTAFTWAMLYCMIDTVTYLLVLIVLSDIQKPSANVIRSMIFLLVNYIEVSADMAVIYYLYNFGKVGIHGAIQFGFMPDDSQLCQENLVNVCLQYANIGINFFFLSLAFGYFANHLHQRKFIS